MASLFQGAPQTATSYTTSSSETPKWMQDAIYNQIQLATGVANTPYQPYSLPTVAELSPLQQQAYQQVQNNAGAWQPALNNVSSGLNNFSTYGTAGNLETNQNQYLRPDLANQNLNSGQGLYGQAANVNAVGSAQPYFNSAAGMSSISAAQPYLTQANQAIGQGLSGSALESAAPYLQNASNSSVQNISDYMNPYTQNVMDVIAKQGARNLSENLLPAVSDSFIKAGQFGGTRMGEFGSRALRDTQEAILNQQSQAAQSGYSNALSASQADLSRQAGLASTAGNLAGTDLSRQLQGANQYSDIGQLSGNLTNAQQSMLSNIGQNIGSLSNQQMSNLTNLGNAQTNAGQTQQQYGLNAAQNLQSAQAQDASRQMSALQQMAALAQQQQSMGAADVAALEGAGAAQQSQLQKQYDAAQSQYNAQQAYPKTQLDWLNAQIRGMAPSVPTTTTNTGSSTGASYSASPLQQLATGLAAYKGLAG
jgi:hypothetical protein